MTAVTVKDGLSSNFIEYCVKAALRCFEGVFENCAVNLAGLQMMIIFTQLQSHSSTCVR